MYIKDRIPLSQEMDFVLLSDSICIGGAYHKLKLALLLSIVLTGDDTFIENKNEKVVIGNELKKINVLTITEDILTIQRLFSYACGFCERATMNSEELFGTAFMDLNGTLHIDGKLYY